MPATNVESKTDQWTSLTVPSDGKVVRHLPGSWEGKVWLTTLAAAPASPFSSSVLLVAPTEKIKDGTYGSDHDHDDVSGGFAITSLRTPLEWSIRFSELGTVRQATVRMWHHLGWKIDVATAQIRTGIQVKGRKPQGAGNVANFTNTAALTTPNGGYTWQLRWALTETEADDYLKAGTAQISLATATNQAFRTWATHSETQPGADKAVITLEKGDTVRLDPPTTSGDSWYHRASFQGCHLAIE